MLWTHGMDELELQPIYKQCRLQIFRDVYIYVALRGRESQIATRQDIMMKSMQRAQNHLAAALLRRGSLG